MRKPWKTIVGFALLGLVIAGACYAYAALHDYTKPTNSRDVAVMIVSVILCPPQLLFAFCIDCEVVGWDGFLQWAIIGILNASLYAAVGGMAADMRKKSE